MKKSKANNVDKRTYNATMEVEYREINGVRRPVISGYAAVFNSDSEDMGFVERIAPGAFDRTDMNDVRALFNHDPNYVLGRTKSGTLRLIPDERGLKYEIDPPDNDFIQSLVVEPIKRGDISQSSFGFTVEVEGDEWRELPSGKWERTIRSVGRLFDVSPVTFPAYEATETTLRSLERAKEQVAQAEEPKPEPTPEATTEPEKVAVDVVDLTGDEVVLDGKVLVDAGMSVTDAYKKLSEK